MEKAADLDILAPSAHTRRRAFHLMTAGTYYERSGLVSGTGRYPPRYAYHFTQKSFSQKCFAQALEVFPLQPRRWRYAGDFVNYDLGRQAYTSGDGRLAMRHFASLLHGGIGFCYQAGILEDYILAYQVRSCSFLLALSRLISWQGDVKIGKERAQTVDRAGLLRVPVFDVTQVFTHSVASQEKYAADLDLTPSPEAEATPDTDLLWHRKMMQFDNGTASPEG